MNDLVPVITTCNPKIRLYQIELGFIEIIFADRTLPDQVIHWIYR